MQIEELMRMKASEGDVVDGVLSQLYERLNISYGKTDKEVTEIVMQWIKQNTLSNR